jgi:hypothetical protein
MGIIKALAVCSIFLTTSASAIIIDFNEYTIEDYSVINQGSGTGSHDVSIDGSTLDLSGNLWKSIALLSNYNVTSNTMLNFEFGSTAEGEIQGIAFDNDSVTSTSTSFQLFGTQNNFGAQAFHDYAISDGVRLFNINVGAFFTGSFDRLVFIMDEDVGVNPAANSSFRNIEICETGSCGLTPPPAPVSAPATLALFGLSFIFIGLRRRQ